MISLCDKFEISNFIIPEIGGGSQILKVGHIT